jgi:cytochrome c peroxidase
VRPPRELAWALAMYVYSLTPPARASTSPDPRGAALFDQHCARCHKNASRGGGLVTAATVGTDPALATGRGRGTGKYRVPGLLGIARGAPYLHHGVVPSLAELLSPARSEPGHRFGTQLSEADRAKLISFVETL